MNRRILHVIPFLWSGAGNVVTRLCLSQSAKNTVAIVTSGRSKGFSDWPAYRRRLRDAGVRHFRIDLFDREPAVFQNSVSSLIRAIREFEPDVVHCHSGAPACAAAIAGDTAGVSFKLIAQCHSWGIGRPEWMNVMDLWGFRQAGRVLYGSRAYERILREGGISRDRISYAPWGLDLSEIQAAVDGYEGRKHREYQVGFVGRIEPRKGQLELVHAFSKFHRRYRESRLELVGPIAHEAYARELRLLMEKGGLRDSVILKGQVRNVYRRLSAWNLFASLSADEGQGIAILEAMALSVPVLARQVAGVEDYLRDGENALAVETASADEVVDRMQWAFEHPRQMARIAQNAHRMVEARYGWSDAVERIDAVYGNS